MLLCCDSCEPPAMWVGSVGSVGLVGSIGRPRRLGKGKKGTEKLNVDVQYRKSIRLPWQQSLWFVATAVHTEEEAKKVRSHSPP